MHFSTTRGNHQQLHPGGGCQPHGQGAVLRGTEGERASERHGERELGDESWRALSSRLALTNCEELG